MKLIECYNIKPHYLIDEHGNVYKNGDKLKTYKDHNGYLQVGLTLNNKKRNKFLIHRLVALTYIKNPLNKATVNHIDGNKLNNHTSNLEWMTLLENTNDAKRLGYNGNYVDITEGLIESVIKDLENGIGVNKICEKYNCSKNFVTRIRQNKRHRHIKRELLSIDMKFSLQTKKEICYLLLNNIDIKSITKYYGLSKNYCYSIRGGFFLSKIVDFVKNPDNNFEPSTTIKNHFNINGE